MLLSITSLKNSAMWHDMFMDFLRMGKIAYQLMFEIESRTKSVFQYHTVKTQSRTKSPINETQTKAMFI